jgi:hypothetical protein
VCGASVSYRLALTGRALAQFSDLCRDQGIHAVLMERIIQLVYAPLGLTCEHLVISQSSAVINP